MQSLISSLGKGRDPAYYCRWHRSRQAPSFAVHGDPTGCAALVRRAVARDELVKLIAPKFVIPYRLSGKHGNALWREARDIVKDGSLREPNGIAFA